MREGVAPICLHATTADNCMHCPDLGVRPASEIGERHPVDAAVGVHGSEVLVAREDGEGHVASFLEGFFADSAETRPPRGSDLTRNTTAWPRVGRRTARWRTSCLSDRCRPGRSRDVIAPRVGVVVVCRGDDAKAAFPDQLAGEVGRGPCLMLVCRTREGNELLDPIDAAHRRCPTIVIPEIPHGERRVQRAAANGQWPRSSDGRARSMFSSSARRCGATAVSQFYRVLWRLKPELKARCVLIAPRDLAPASSSGPQSNPPRVLERPVTRDAVARVLTAFAARNT